MLGTDLSTQTFTTRSAEGTRALGQRFALSLKPGSVVALSGDLGSGKTTFVQGVVRGLGVTAWANSPTFTLINEYQGRVKVYHCDFYRIGDPTELDTLALDEVFYGDGVALVEWPEVAEDWIPKDAIRLRITRTGPKTRRIDLGR